MDESASFFESPSAPVRLSKSLPEQVADLLLAALADGSLEPGTRLKEEALANRFSVSRTTVREAIALLVRRGIAEHVPRFGARIAAFDAGEVEEIFNIRAQLLGLAARLAVEKPSAELNRALSAQVEQLVRLAADSATDPAAYATVSIETQRLLIAANGRQRLVSMYEDLSNQVVWHYAVRRKSVSFQTPERRSESAADWRRLVDAILAADADAAERNAKALLQASYRAVEAQWKQRERSVQG